jgi:hypothetical protein
MPKKKQVNADKLIKAVEAGKPAREIMDKFGINNTTQLKVHYLDALAKKGKIKPIVTRSGRPPRPEKRIEVNKRGSLIVPKELVEEMGFSEEDTFSIQKSNVGMSLKKTG